MTPPFAAFDPPREHLVPNPKLRFLDQCREACRFRHFSPRTEEAYVHWIRQFILWSGKRHPRDLGPEEVRQFLGHLARARAVSASTQNQALNALVFMYREVVGRKMGELGEIARARRPVRIPVVLSRPEMRAVLAQLSGTQQLIGRVPLWHRAAVAGRLAGARQGPGFRARSGGGAGRQG